MSLNKIEQIVSESLMSRGFSTTEALNFIKVLKGEKNEKILSNNIMNQIDCILNKHTKKISEYEKLIKDNNRLRIINTELKDNLKEFDTILEESINNTALLKRTIKLALINFGRELENIRKTINGK